MSALDPTEATFLDDPIAVGPAGSLRTTGADDHIRDLILEVLFTEPGERVNLPEFGCGVKQLVFAPNSDILRATTQFLIDQNLQRWLGDRIEIEQVVVSSDPGEEELLRIEVTYLVKRDGGRRQVSVAL